jgi:hypothetical protein
MAINRSLRTIIPLGTLTLVVLVPFPHGSRAARADVDQRPATTTESQQLERFLDRIDLDLAIEIGDTPAWRQALISSPALQETVLRIERTVEQRGFLRQFGNPVSRSATPDPLFQRHSNEIRSLLESRGLSEDTDSQRRIGAELANRYDRQTLRRFRRQLLDEVAGLFPPQGPNGFVRPPVATGADTRAKFFVAGVAATAAGLTAFMTRSVYWSFMMGAVGTLAAIWPAAFYSYTERQNLKRRLLSMADLVRSSPDTVPGAPVPANAAATDRADCEEYDSLRLSPRSTP